MTRFAIILLMWLPAMAAPVTSSSDALKAVAFDQKLNGQVPLDAAFVDDQNQPVRLAEVFGNRPVVLVMVQFRCPMLCNIVLNDLVESLKSVSLEPGKDYSVVIVSIDPRETPMLAIDKKHHLLQQFERPASDGGWHLLVGDDATVHRLADAIGFRYAYDRKNDQYAHPSGVVVLTPAGRVSHYFFGLRYPPVEVRNSLIDAAGEKIGAPEPSLLLRCFYNDPRMGRVSMVVMNIVRLGALATVLTMVVAWVVLSRRARRASAGVKEAGA